MHLLSRGLRIAVVGGGELNGESPSSTRDLLPSENRFLAAMQQLGFGRFESLRIASGELVLDPWPTTVRGVKFGSESLTIPQTVPDNYLLKRQVINL